VRPEVRHTREFERVASLARRRPNEGDAQAWAEVLSAELRVPGARVALRMWQAYCLADGAAHMGGWWALPVGFGKTLLAEMIAALLGATRSLLVIPANLRDKTYADRASFLGRWKLASPPPVLMTPSELTQDSRRDFLAEFKPQVVIVDEGDELANPDSGCSRRLTRHAEATTAEECAFFVMSGTPARKSVMNYAHQLFWTLRDGAPVPRNKEERRMWAAALDHQTREAARRPGPGPLGHSRGAALEWFQRRLAETPGVVIIDGDSAEGIPLTIRQRTARECPKLDAAFKRFGVEQCNPDGIPVSDPLSRWKMDGDLGCGLYRYWSPPPPEEWREAYRAIAKFVRDSIAHSTHARRPLDTEGQVLRAHESHPVVERWLAVKPTFNGRTRVKWISTATIESVRDWLREQGTTPAIVWTGNVEFAEALAKATRLPYYGRNGQDANGRGLHAAPAGQSLIASWLANKKGFNLQAWRRALIVQPPQSAKWLEQTFGRHHRAGQDQPVIVDILITSGGTLDAFDAAIGEATHARRSVGLTQKILRAEIVRARPRVTASNKFRWARRTRD
jgi:hypothetical protein